MKNNDFRPPWDVVSIRERIALYVGRGTISSDVLAGLVHDGYCAPLEFELLDYKETIVGVVGIERIVKAIVAMHNTYGGYLIFGVGDARDGMGFPVIGIDPAIVNLEQLKDRVTAVTETRILLTGCNVFARTPQGTDVTLFLLSVPRRSNDSQTVDFKKDAKTEHPKHTPEFKLGDFFYRDGDTSLKAIGTKIFWLTGERANPYLPGNERRGIFTEKSVQVQHNLPDRSAICPKFIRREEILNQLWTWLGDDLSHWRVLAGAGGVGKSSVAYEFAEQLIRYPEQPFDQIVWLSAKKKQFDGLLNDYRRMPEIHYESFDELLTALCIRLAYEESEVAGKSQNDRKRLLRSGFGTIPTFVIVDDVDSLQTDEQKQVGELVAWLSGNNSRFLITTRHNHTFSSSTSIHLEGFERDEFDDFLAVLSERLPAVSALNKGQRDNLFKSTHGSPLLSESICRNLRYGSFDEALTSWQGKSGDLARAAVLKKEISQLSPEAKRVLVAASMLRSASTSELAAVTDFPKTIVEGAIDELDRLFLVARPPIAKEPRFAVNETTARLVLDSADTLVGDHRKLQKAVEGLSQGADLKRKASDSIVAAAIRQANALLGEDKFSEALKTLDATHVRKKHPDLLSYKAKLLSEAKPPRLDEARLLVREAFSAGGRRPALFDIWFQSEWSLKNYFGAIEASEAALRHKIPTELEWNVRLSAAHKARAAERGIADVEGIRKDLTAASKAMSAAVKKSGASERQQWLGKLFEIHNQLLDLNRTQGPSIRMVSLLLDEISVMNRNGDTRRSLAWAAVNSIDRIARKKGSLKGKEGQASKLIERIEQIIKFRKGSNGNQANQDEALFLEWEKVRSRLFGDE